MCPRQHLTIAVCVLLAIGTAVKPAMGINVVIDASRDGGLWWFPQANGFNSDDPHQGKEFADYLRGRGCVVVELGRRTRITDQLKSANMVVRIPCSSSYSEDEVRAYLDYVEQGGSLLLVGAAVNAREAPDAVAKAFDIEFADVLPNVRVSRWADEPVLAQLPTIGLGRGGRIKKWSTAFTPLGRDGEDNVIVGAMPYHKGKVIALSVPWFVFTHEQSTPLISYILHVLGGLPLEKPGVAGEGRLAGPPQSREPNAIEPDRMARVQRQPRQGPVADPRGASRGRSMSEAGQNTLRGHTKTIKSVAFSPNGAMLATASWDGTVKLWNPTTGRLQTTIEAFPSGVSSVAFSPDGKLVAAASWKDASVKLWAVATAAETVRLSADTTSYGVNSVAFSPDGKTLAAACSDNTVKLWDIEKARLRATLQGHTHFVQAVAFSPDGRLLASGCFDYGVKLWDAVTGKERTTLSPGAFAKASGHRGAVNCVAFSSDNKTLASGSDDRTVRLWDVATGKERVVLEGHSGKVTSLAISTDYITLATGSDGRGGEVKLWDLATGTVLATLREHSKTVEAVAFSPDGKTMATASLDLTVKLWDVATLRTVPAPTSDVHPPRERATVPVVPPTEALASSDLRTRNRAAVTIAKSGGPDAKAAIPVLIEAVRNKTLETRERYMAIIALSNFSSETKRVTPVLLEALDDDDRSIRSFGTQALIRLGPDAETAVPALIPKLETGANDIRANAASVLSRIGPDAKAAMPVLVDMIVTETHANLERQRDQFRQTGRYNPSQDRDSYRSRTAAVEALAAINPVFSDSEPRLIPALVVAHEKDSNYGLTEAAAKALQKIYPYALEFIRPSDPRLPSDATEIERVTKAAIPVLVESLADEDALIREAAAAAIGSTAKHAVHTVTASAALTKALEDEDGLVRVSAALALARVDPQTTTAFPVLIHALQSTNASIRNASIRAVLMLGEAAQPAIRALADLTLNTDGRFNEKAAMALGSIGPNAMPPLINALGDSDPSVRERAARAFLAVARWYHWQIPEQRGVRQSLSSQKAIPLVQGIPALIKALADSERSVRSRSAQVLGSLGESADSAVQPLIKVLDDDRYVRWEAVEALRKIDPRAAPDAIARAIADRPTMSNANGDRLTLLTIDPPLPAILEAGEPLTVRCSYTLESAPSCRIWVYAYTEGQRTQGQGTSGSAEYQKGDGEEEGTVSFATSARIDQIRISMTYDLESHSKPIVELVIDADARWKNNAEVDNH